MHTPKKGTPACRAARAAGSRPLSRRARAQAPNAPTPGQHDGIGRLDLGRISDEACRRADVLQRLLGRAQVADPVVEHGDLDHRLPLVEGIPPPSTAPRRAAHRATPLKLASSMWWVFLPRRRWMCSVRFPAVAKARQNSSAS